MKSTRDNVACPSGIFSFLFAPSRRWKIIQALLVGALSGAASTFIIGLVHMLIQKHASTLSVGSLVVLAYFGLCSIRLLGATGANWILFREVHSAVLDLRQQLIKHLFRSPLITLEKMGSAKIFTLLTEDITSLGIAFAALPNLCVNLSIVLGCFIYLLWLSPAYFSICMAFLLLGIWLYRTIERAAMKSHRSARGEQDVLFAQLHLITNGIKELKVNASRRQSLLEATAATGAAFSRLHVRGASLYSLAFNSGATLHLVLLGLLCILPLELMDNAVLSAFALTILYVAGPLQGAVANLPGLSQARIALQRLHQFGFELGVASEPLVERTVPLPEMIHSIELTGVTYAYESVIQLREFQLGPIDLELRAGRVTFLMGGNGGGKSTLVKLLSGLYLPTSGQLKINGQPFEPSNMEQYRERVSVAFQDSCTTALLGGDSHFEVPPTALPLIDLLKLREIVRDGLPGWGATTLSYGQKRRIELALLHSENRPVCIFDEWAANQDPWQRKTFYMQYLPMIRALNKIVVVVTHDDAFLDCADHVYKLDNGRVSTLK